MIAARATLARWRSSSRSFWHRMRRRPGRRRSEPLRWLRPARLLLLRDDPFRATAGSPRLSRSPPIHVHSSAHPVSRRAPAATRIRTTFPPAAGRPTRLLPRGGPAPLLATPVTRAPHDPDSPRFLGGTCSDPATTPAECRDLLDADGLRQERAARLLALTDAGPPPVGCDSGLVELRGCEDFACGYSSGWCYNPTSCGGDGERACCIIDIEGTVGCDSGLNEVAGASGDFSAGSLDLIGQRPPAVSCLREHASLTTPIAEPDLGWTAPATPDACAAEQPPGYADLHAHMFSHLGHGGAGIAGEPYPDDGDHQRRAAAGLRHLSAAVAKDGDPLYQVKDAAHPVRPGPLPRLRQGRLRHLPW